MNKLIDDIKADPRTIATYEGVTVTPAMAKQILAEMNTDNRPFKPATVKHYAYQIKSGNWKNIGDSIRFSKKGRLLDGQHRLMGIVESNTSIKTDIKTGLPDEVFDLIDTGKNRSSGDVLAIKGYKNPVMLAAAIKIVYRYDNKQLGNNKVIDKFKRSTNHDIATWDESHNMELMQECIENGIKCNNKLKIFAAGTYAGLMYILARKNKEQAFAFFEKLASGENISTTNNSAIYNLRQRLVNIATANKNVSYEERYALVLKAWNLHREGTVVKRLLWGDGEDFPRAK